MIVIDFVVYFLTSFFEKNPQKLIWSTPIQKSCYLAGLATMGYIVFVIELLKFTVMKTMPLTYVTKYTAIIAALVIVQFYTFLYLKKKRYELISNGRFKKINYQIGIIFSIAFIFGSFLSVVLTYIYFVPAGSGGLH